MPEFLSTCRAMRTEIWRDPRACEGLDMTGKSDFEALQAFKAKYLVELSRGGGAKVERFGLNEEKCYLCTRVEVKNGEW